ncbi:hypothetical protein KDW_12370 [Dictyobacter vulcani]|uniref:Uncharacterized protein n=2 Tax=Dictyobacter vulcani TaxID=2607529 RepID=A0A5J4KHG6_9CHLR|nr:hypothetical protein KDW_12370 [Dictyobacter vulcani]
MKVYSSQYFTIQYPANWIITRLTTGGSSQQRVQFRPSATSTIFADITVLHNSGSTATQLLHMDPDVKLGSGLSTSSVVYHGVPWMTGIVNLPASDHTPGSKREVAYTNQKTPYRLEFGTTTDKFDAYRPVFNNMFASFQAQDMPLATATATAPATNKPGPQVTPTATSLAQGTPPSAATPTPPTTLAGIKVYSGQYFTIQYPASWLITNITTGGTYQQTVQFRPSVTSAAFVNINVLNTSGLSADQLLNMDPDLKLGSGLSTSSATYNGMLWKIGTVNQLATLLNPASKTEIAYTNQKNPYKIEFSAPPDTFDANTQAFNTMLASFKPAG